MTDSVMFRYTRLNLSDKFSLFENKKIAWQDMPETGMSKIRVRFCLQG